MRPEKTMYADATAGVLAQHKGGLLTSVKGQKNLPRYFARVMRIVQTLQVLFWFCQTGENLSPTASLVSH